MKIRAKNGDVVDLVELRARVENPYSCLLPDVNEWTIALLDALEGTLSTENPVDSVRSSEYNAFDDALNAVRAAAGVIEEATS